MFITLHEDINTQEKSSILLSIANGEDSVTVKNTATYQISTETSLSGIYILKPKCKPLFTLKSIKRTGKRIRHTGN